MNNLKLKYCNVDLGQYNRDIIGQQRFRTHRNITTIFSSMYSAVGYWCRTEYACLTLLRNYIKFFAHVYWRYPNNFQYFIF